jgi:hypothetical protein
MDEIFTANFMVLHDVLEDDQYDLIIADESWETDHYLHENPELKRTPFVWLTDFVGWLPMPDGGDGERALTTDYNAEMIEHIARYPRLRNRSIFVGNPQDIVADSFGRDLPTIREWTEAHFDFSGYITGFDPALLSNREELRHELGFHPDEIICMVSVGDPESANPSFARSSTLSPSPTASFRSFAWSQLPVLESTPPVLTRDRMGLRCAASYPTSTGTLRAAMSPSCKGA